MTFDPTNRAGRILFVWIAMQFAIVPMALVVGENVGIVPDAGMYLGLAAVPLAVILMVSLTLGERLGE
jgi:hypothetical protein